MRSTSGITCCHFFCSAVFSMPVCRYPIVGAAESTVSPSSSSTRRSTPCVLGCCGPMLTVIVSVRMSGIDDRSLYQVADHVQQRPMDFLHARGHVGGHVHVHGRRAADRSAVAAGQRDRGDGLEHEPQVAVHHLLMERDGLAQRPPNQLVHPRVRRSFTTLARNSSSVTCSGWLAVGVFRICTG